MRRWTGMLVVALAGLLAASALGVAGAQQTTPTTDPPPPRGIIANGAGQRTLSSTATPDAFRSAFRDALTDALADAKGKAAFIAEKSGLTLGAVQSVVETSNTVLDGCNYAVGVQSLAAGAPAPSAKKPTTPKKKKKAKRKTAHKAQDDTSYPCPVSASVTTRYEVTG
jgi:hypothetical protein